MEILKERYLRLKEIIRPSKNFSDLESGINLTFGWVTDVTGVDAKTAWYKEEGHNERIYITGAELKGLIEKRRELDSINYVHLSLPTRCVLVQLSPKEWEEYNNGLEKDAL